MHGHKNKAHQTVRTECTWRRPSRQVAGNIWASKTTRHFRRVTFASVRVARRHRRGTSQGRTWPASFGRGFGSPSSKKPRLRNDPPTSAGHFSMRRGDQSASARHFAGPNMARAVWQGLCQVIVEENRGPETTRHALRVILATAKRPTGWGLSPRRGAHGGLWVPRRFPWVPTRRWPTGIQGAPTHGLCPDARVGLPFPGLWRRGGNQGVALS
jgi:hypothetical protein